MRNPLVTTKLLVVGILLIDDFRRLAMVVFEGLTGNRGFSYSRSKFISNMAFLLGSLPFITLPLLVYNILS